jgi:hypothetical protein
MSNGGSERKLIGKWRLDFVANAGDPSLSAFPGTPSNHIQQPPECLLMADTVAKVAKRWAMIFSAKS